MDTYIQRKPDDFHVHLRDFFPKNGHLADYVIPFTSAQFRRALVMPNTNPPILQGFEARAYELLIKSVALRGKFQSLMTIKLSHDTVAKTIHEAREAGVLAAKCYPVGVTTNSGDGVANLLALEEVLATMQEVGLVLSVHAEKPGAFCLDAEREYLPVLAQVIEKYPRLRIVVEHISSEAAVEFVRDAPDTVAATITAHHLLLTLDDLVRGKVRPHNVCMPIAKRYSDREKLWEAVASGNPKYFFGSDSAPHLRESKECASGSAGCFTAPVAMPLLVQLFEKEGLVTKLAPFTSEYGAVFYRLPLNREKLRLRRKPWTVPAKVCGIVPFMAQESLDWQVAE